MASRVGTWDVVESIWATPGATPTATKYVAKREMIGQFLQETIQPAPGAKEPDFRRMYWLGYNRVEGRWKYVSLDTRNPVELMPAASFGPGEPASFTLQFEPFALPGTSPTPSGQLQQMQEIISQQDADHDRAEEFFVLTDGTGKKWLAFRYEYVRRR